MIDACRCMMRYIMMLTNTAYCNENPHSNWCIDSADCDLTFGNPSSSHAWLKANPDMFPAWPRLVDAWLPVNPKDLRPSALIVVDANQIQQLDTSSVHVLGGTG